MESSFSPREIVSELDKFIIGQNNAKRAVAVALRNRWRRKQLDESLREESFPKFFQQFVLVPLDIFIELLKSVSNHHCYYIRLPFGR